MLANLGGLGDGLLVLLDLALQLLDLGIQLRVRARQLLDRGLQRGDARGGIVDLGSGLGPGVVGTSIEIPLRTFLTEMAVLTHVNSLFGHICVGDQAGT